MTEIVSVTDAEDELDDDDDVVTLTPSDVTVSVVCDSAVTEVSEAISTIEDSVEIRGCGVMRTGRGFDGSTAWRIGDVAVERWGWRLLVSAVRAATRLGFAFAGFGRFGCAFGLGFGLATSCSPAAGGGRALGPVVMTRVSHFQQMIWSILTPDIENTAAVPPTVTATEDAVISRTNHRRTACLLDRDLLLK